jgi:hypothetical protein
VLPDTALTHETSQAANRKLILRDRAQIAALLDQFRRDPVKISQRQFAQRQQVARTTLQGWLGHSLASQACAEEVAFFESPAGVDFLHRLQVAAHLVMSLMGACGIRLVSLLFRYARLGPFVACSYGAQQQVAKRLQREVVRFGEQERQRLGEKMPLRQVTLCQDETFHPQVCLVAIEPVSNFIVLERYTQRRDAATWTEAMEQALCGLPVKVVQGTSDEGKGIVRHVKTELGVHHSPDVFHVQHEISCGTAAPLATRVRAAQADLEQASARLQAVVMDQQEAATLPPPVGRPVNWEARVQNAQQELGRAQQGLQAAQAHREAMQQTVRELGQVYHPFDLQTGLARTDAEIATELGYLMAKARRGTVQAGLSQGSQERIDKAARVVPALVATVAFFHCLVAQRVAAVTESTQLRRLLHKVLIPALYLERVAKAAKGAEIRAALRQVATTLRQTLRAAPAEWVSLPEAARTALWSLAKDCADLFQRSSSCVEGRNGQLALRHHHLHQISPQRLEALTVIHNYVLRRSDGTTAAHRFFGAPCRDLFTVLCIRLPPPARPRQRRPSGAACPQAT